MSAADVIIEVLDARDPLGSRCKDVERYVRQAGSDKKIILLLNKMGKSLCAKPLFALLVFCCNLRLTERSMCICKTVLVPLCSLLKLQHLSLQDSDQRRMPYLNRIKVMRHRENFTIK